MRAEILGSFIAEVGYKRVMSTQDPPRFRRAIAGKDMAVLCFVTIVFLILNHAGSLVAAAAAAIGGLFGIFGHRLPHPRSWPVPVWIGLVFLLWCGLSSVWSPYDSPRDIPGVARFCLGVPLYGLLIFVMMRQPENNGRILRLIIMSLIPLSAFVFAVDFVTDFAIFRLADPGAIDGDIIKNLSHGLSVLLMCLPPAIFFFARHGRGGVMIAASVYILALIAAANSGNAAAILAVPTLAVMMFAAFRFPAKAIRIALIAPIAVILLAPIISIIASETSQATKDALPFSWEWRAETWGYLAQKIADNPLAGNGFDSLRTMKDTFDARGFEGLSLVPLHAHNFGLQIWVEVGLVGAILAALFLWEAAGALIRSAWLTPRRASALCGTLAAAVIFSSLSYSAWQDWWWGAIAFALSFSVLIPDDA